MTVRHLPTEMTPELMELARWAYRSLKPGEPWQTISTHGGEVDSAGSKMVLDVALEVPDFTSWRTYGVLRGVLDDLEPAAEIELFAWCDRHWRVHWMFAKEPPNPGYQGPLRDTMIEAVIDGIRHIVEQKEAQ